MSDLNMIKLHDRVKELSNSTGTGSITLDGAVAGFSSFSDFVGQSGLVYYAMTDGTNYEVGSGRFLDSGRDVGTFSSNQLVRFPKKSTNSNNLVNWAAGTKEVFVTYPSDATVYTVEGIDSATTPQKSGMAFWSSSSTLNHSTSIVVDAANSRIGMDQSSPQYKIDIGGNAQTSQIRASGLIVNSSGIVFSGVNSLRQTEPFQKNQADATTGATSVIFYSGAVEQILTLQKQSANNMLAGPTTGSAAYPAFRALTVSDIPDLGDTYAATASGNLYGSNIGVVSGIAVNSSGYLSENIAATSGALRTDLTTASGTLRADLTTASGTLRADLTTASGTLRSDLTTASGALFVDIVVVSGLTVAGEVYGVASGTVVVNNLLTASGALRSDISVNAANIVTASGALSSGISVKTKDIIATSGTLRRDVTVASGFAAAASFTPSVNVPATTPPLKYNYSGTAIATENVIVSQSGFFTLPIFSNSGDLPPAISGFRGALAICQFGTDHMSLVFCAPISSGLGYSWYKPSGTAAGSEFVGGYKPI